MQKHGHFIVKLQRVTSKMMEMTLKKDTLRTAAQFKGSLFSMAVLTIQSSNLDAIIQQVELTCQQAPNLFHQAPIILDLKQVAEFSILPELVQSLRKLGLVPVAIMGANETQVSQVKSLNLALLPTQKDSKSTAIEKKQHNTWLPPKIIDHPIRSGQQIYAANADLIVLQSVSHGAEVLADGHIHIYGTLNGKAIAGAHGKQDAQIFCQRLEAELISIAGVYALQDDYANEDSPCPKHIRLVNQQLEILSLTKDLALA